MITSIENSTSFQIKKRKLATRSLVRKSNVLNSFLILYCPNGPIGKKGRLSMNLLIFAGIVVFSVLVTSTIVLAQSPQRISGGVFIPRNGGYEGHIGQSHVFFNQNAGGVMSVVTGEWSRFNHMAKLDMVFTIKTTGSELPLEVRQSFDKNPRVLFLEEGNDRIGLRVLFKLYGPNNDYHGHGMTETWLYPDGQIFVTAAAMFENTAAHEAVTKARLDIDIPKALRAEDPGDFEVAMDNAMASNRHLLLTSADPSVGVSGLSLYWRTGRMEHDTYIFRSDFGKQGAPTYFRWPDYFRQAYTQLTLPDYAQKVERTPWPPGRGVYIEKISPSQMGVQLNWPIDPKQPNPTASFNTLFRLAMVKDKDMVEAFVESEHEPVKMIVTGGIIHGNDKGYNDQEGCYEIRKTGKNPLIITLPADPLARIIRVKVIDLSGHGAVTMTLDGKPLVPQLTTDGGIADDPLAPIHDHPEAPANAGMVTVKLLDKPQTLRVEEEDGIQLVYQSRDSRRNFMIYSTKTGPLWAGLRFSLVDGHARHMRAYGKQDWALTENLLHWFAWMGYTPEQMLDQLRDFVVIKNGPDEIIFKYTSNNANDGAQSEYEVSVRADSPAMQINVSATFTVLEQWPYKSVQFFDVFPFKGVEPRDWWYDDVLLMSHEGKWKTYETVRQSYHGQKDLEQITGPTFQGLYSSDRGNMLMLTKDFKPELPTDYVICGNYVDLHTNVLFDDLQKQPFTLEKGFQSSVEYELAIWGDKSLTRDQLIEIGRQSLEAGTLVIPPK